MEASECIGIDTCGAGEIRQQKSTGMFEREATEAGIGEPNTDSG